MTWKIASCTVTGEKNKESHRPCQDYSDFFHDDINDIVFGVIADGAGSKKYSDIGAKIAVEESIKFIKYQTNKILYKDKFEATKFFKILIEHVTHVLEEESKNLNCNSEELYCTLLIFFVTQDYFAAIQIGDGLIVIKIQGEDEYKLLFTPDKGLYKNTTSFVNEKNVSINEKIGNIACGVGTINFIFVSSDGMEDICLKFLGFSRFGEREWKPLVNFFMPIHSKILKVRDINKFSQALKDKLSNIEISKRFRDDKAIIICCNMSNYLKGEVFKPVTKSEDECHEEYMISVSPPSKLQVINHNKSNKTHYIINLLKIIKQAVKKLLALFLKNDSY